jgi:pyruvate dehydrogenase E2 component (dihydrolipoamide acetyltransferase)
LPGRRVGKKNKKINTAAQYNLLHKGSSARKHLLYGDSNLNQAIAKNIPLTHIQKLIAQRMLASKQTKPCFYIQSRADVTELMDARHKLKKTTGVKITTNAFYIRALARSAMQYPLVLGKVEGDNIRIADSANVGFAVSAPQGLVVPVMKNAQNMTLVDIAKTEKLLTDKARANRLSLDEVSDETIALSNLGAYGIDSFIGIVPPPASIILAVGNTLHQTVVRNGRVCERKMVSLSLAADNTVINADYAAGFLNHLKELLENPASLED